MSGHLYGGIIFYPLGNVSEPFDALQSRNFTFVGKSVLTFKPHRRGECDHAYRQLKCDCGPHAGRIILNTGQTMDMIARREWKLQKHLPVHPGI